MAIVTSLLILNWNLSTFSWPLFLLLCAMQMPVYVLTHNHNHLPMWKNSWLNRLQDYWLTLFYGFPVFAWIPTHNQNHHRFNNKAGDDTITYRISEKNNLWTWLTYPLVSSSHQMRRIKDCLVSNIKNRPSIGYHYLSQIFILVIYVAFFLYLDFQKALLYIVIPHQIGLNSVLLINYIQHVHTDELSEWNHSRNFVGKFLNWVMLNNGYHTIHHMRPDLHWSELKKEHDKIAHNILPELKTSMFSFIVKNYFLPFAFKKERSQSLRLKRIQDAKKLSPPLPARDKVDSAMPSTMPLPSQNTFEDHSSPIN